MRLTFVEICGFRGYRKRVRIDFARDFTIIDGRNGVGKSTLFDAIEFAITGALSKYGDMKSAGETVADYLWWTGEGPPPSDRYVEVGFSSGEQEIRIKRTQIGEVDGQLLQSLTEALCDVQLAPKSPLSQICATTIIRDEHITNLSLDMKETERYALLRDALGAIDAQKWIDRAASLVTMAKNRTANAQHEVAMANSEVALNGRRIDEIRASLVADSAIGEASQRLQNFANSEASLDKLTGPARERIATIRGQIDTIQVVLAEWPKAEKERERTESLSSAVDEARKAMLKATAELEAHPTPEELHATSDLASQAEDLIALVSIGRKVGLRDGHCPLCTLEQSHDHFLDALQSAETLARRLNEQAAHSAEQRELRSKVAAQLEAARLALKVAEDARSVSTEVLKNFESKKASANLSSYATAKEIELELNRLVQMVEVAERDVRILDTLQLSEGLQRAAKNEADTKIRLARAQEKYSRSRKVEIGAQALHDSARRAASETLDTRLERVLPLMSELYRRLKPHPLWSDIEYSIRGDVRKFLKLQVGSDLNPQFLFSSGQRRATGLAFLLSVNLSLAWSRWKTILLDDPVQHVDDFRSVHLAEVLAQLVVDDRQIICAVEDAALADLLARRLPVKSPGTGKRITLGPDSDGALTMESERSLMPLTARAMANTLPKLEAS